MKSKIGANLWVEDEVEFTKNESVLLMLKDENLGKQLFRVFVGIAGKRPVSDRDAVIKELKAQGKWPEENQTENKTNDTGMTEENAGTTDEQEESYNQTQKSNYSFYESCQCDCSNAWGNRIHKKKTIKTTEEEFMQTLD